MRILIVALLLGSTVARAEPWYHDKHRDVHVAVTVTAGAMYVLSESVLKPSLAPSTCSWCAPPAIDRQVRDALVWSDTKTPYDLSNIEGFVVAPLTALGLTVAGALTSDDPSWTRVIDDTVPILEAVTVSQVVNQAVKFGVARERPFVHYAAPGRAHDIDDDVSFFSAHANLTFALATSAGLVAHRRHSWTEPYIWAAGMTLAATTSYLRIASDRHYLTDVLTGSAVGVIAGILGPKLYFSTVEVMPTGNGLAVAGSF